MTSNVAHSMEVPDARMDRQEFFAIMAAFPTGVAVVTTIGGDGMPRGLTTNALCSVSADPPMMLVCVDKTSQTLPALLETGQWVVNFLCAGRDRISDLFASKDPEKFNDVAWRAAGNGMPWLFADTIGYAVCATLNVIEAGDHYILVGKVEGGEPSRDGPSPLMYFRRSYRSWPSGDA